MSAPRARSHGFLQLTESQQRHQQEALRRREALRARAEARLPAMHFGSVSAGSTGSRSQPRARTPPPFLPTSFHRSLSPVPLSERAQPNRETKANSLSVGGGKDGNGGGRGGKPPSVPDPRCYSFSYRAVPTSLASAATPSPSAPHRPVSPPTSQQDEHHISDMTPPRRATSAPRSGATSRHRPRSNSSSDLSPRARQRARGESIDAPSTHAEESSGGDDDLNSTPRPPDKEKTITLPTQDLLSSRKLSAESATPPTAPSLALPRPGLLSSSPPSSTPRRVSSTRWANEFPLPRISAVAAPLLERLSSATPQRRPFAGTFPTPTTSSQPASSIAEAALHITPVAPPSTTHDVVHAAEEWVKAGSPTPTMEGLVRSLQASAEKRACECARPAPGAEETCTDLDMQTSHENQDGGAVTQQPTMPSPTPQPVRESVPSTASSTAVVAAAGGLHSEPRTSSPCRRSAQPTPASTTPSCMAAATAAGSPSGFSPSPWPTSAGLTGHSVETFPQPLAQVTDEETNLVPEHTPSPSLSEHHVELSLYASAEKRPRIDDAPALTGSVISTTATTNAGSPDVHGPPQTPQGVEEEAGQGAWERGAETDETARRVHTPTPSPVPTPKAVATSVLASADKRRTEGHIPTPAPPRASRDLSDSASPAYADAAGTPQCAAINLLHGYDAQNGASHAEDDAVDDSASPLRAAPRHAVVLSRDEGLSAIGTVQVTSDGTVDSLPPASTPSPVPTREHLDCSVFASAEKRPRGMEEAPVSGSPSRIPPTSAMWAASPCSPLATSSSPTLTTRNITDSVRKLRRLGDASETTRSGAPEPTNRSWPTEPGAQTASQSEATRCQPSAASPSVTAEDVSQALDVLQERQMVQSRSGPVERRGGSLDGSGPQTNKENVRFAVATTATVAADVVVARRATSVVSIAKVSSDAQAQGVTAKAKAQREPEKERGDIPRSNPNRATLTTEDAAGSVTLQDDALPGRGIDDGAVQPVGSPSLSDVCVQSAMFVDCRSAPPTPAVPHLPEQYLQLERDVAAITAGRTRVQDGEEGGRGSLSPTIPPAVRSRPRRSSLALVGAGVEGGPGGCAAPVQVPHMPASPHLQQGGTVKTRAAPAVDQSQEAMVVPVARAHDDTQQITAPPVTRSTMTEDVAVQVGCSLPDASDETGVSHVSHDEKGGSGIASAGYSPLPRPVTLRSQVGPRFAAQQQPGLPPFQPCTSLHGTARLIAAAAPPDDAVASFVLDPPTPVNPVRYPSRLAEARRAARTGLNSTAHDHASRHVGAPDDGHDTPRQCATASSSATPHTNSDTCKSVETGSTQRRALAAGSGRRSEVQRLLEMLPQDVADEVRLSTGTTTTATSSSAEEEGVGGSPGDRHEALSMVQRVAQRPRRVYYDYGYYLMYLNEQQQRHRRHQQQRDGGRKGSRGGTAGVRGHTVTPRTHADTESQGLSQRGSHVRGTPAAATEDRDQHRLPHDVTADDAEPAHGDSHQLQISTRLSAELQSALFKTPPPRSSRGSISLTAQRTPAVRSEARTPVSAATPPRDHQADDNTEGTHTKQRRRHPPRTATVPRKQRGARRLRAKKGRRQQ